MADTVAYRPTLGEWVGRCCTYCAPDSLHEGQGRQSDRKIYRGMTKEGELKGEFDRGTIRIVAVIIIISNAMDPL
eukprot:COSAG01_NODE_3908_length_5556_cov_3.550852_4_plen_75_part_00